MWQYEKKLQYPVNIKNCNPKLAKIIISQFGGPDGELAASLRYLSQRYSMPYNELKGLLTDIGTCVLKKRPRVRTLLLYFYFLDQVAGDSAIKIGNISSLPSNIAKESNIFEKAEYSA